jgi:hypothetical protein
MGFGFNLFFAFILVPGTIILLLIWLLSKKQIFGKTLGTIWLGILGLVILSYIVKALTATKELKKKDYHGQYIVDRDFFPGKQANWQYNNFRFEIKDNDSIYFYVTQHAKVLKLYSGTITTTQSNNSQRLIMHMVQPTHHVMSSDPTTYRNAWGFYLVFHSPKFNNMFFKKGVWTPIEE